MISIFLFFYKGIYKLFFVIKYLWRVVNKYKHLIEILVFVYEFLYVKFRITDTNLSTKYSVYIVDHLIIKSNESYLPNFIKKEATLLFCL